MRLKQVKLAGFKSFVDPTSITFPGNRSAVVGPNGCGKSNIIDAVRWVMGESSAKQLRGENLTDVIFNGSNARKPTAMASIELLFDNSDGRVGGEYASYAELSIRRQVTRDAQSQYFLNGSKCRRRDIQDVFLGTGFGPRSYSIIEQGMISQLVEARPEDLRIFLEEAAGISKYKERRKETANRIKHTRENLERLSDIRDELGRQLERLQRQAKAAERYRALKKTEARAIAELYALRYRALQEDMQSSRAQIRDFEVALEKAVAGQRRLDADIERERQTYAQANERFNAVQGEFYELGADIARVEESIQFSQSRVQQLEGDLQAVDQQAEETAHQLMLDNAAIRAIDADLSSLGPEVEAARGRDAAAQQALEAFEDAFREHQAAWESFSSEVSGHERDAQVQASRVEHIDQLLQRLQVRAEQLETDAAGVPEVTDGQVETLALQIQETEREHRAAEADIDQCVREHGRAKEELLHYERTLEEARNDVQTLRHQLAGVQAIQEAALGRENSDAGEWLTRNDLAQAVRLGEALHVAPGWERAVETVLGDFVQGLLVDDIESFAERLQGAQVRGVTLIAGGSVPADGGNLPALATLVRSDQVAIGSLLHDVFAAESVAVGFAERANLAPGQSIVTREGVWIGKDWVRVLPEAALHDGVIERAQEIDTLEARVGEAEHELASLQRSVSEGRERIDELERERESLQHRVTKLGRALADLQTDHGVRRVRVEEAEARRVRVDTERADIESQIAAESENLAHARDALRVAEAALEDLGERRPRLLTQRDGASEQVQGARSHARDERDALYALDTRWQTLESRHAASVAARERLIKQRDALAAQKQALTASIGDTRTPLPDLQARLETKLSQRADVESRQAELRAELETIDANVRALEQQRSEAAAAVDTVRGNLERVRVSFEGLSVQEKTLTEQISRTEFTLATLLEEMPEDASERAWEEELEKLDRRIQRLGAINLAAIEEYDQQSERKVYLDQQNADLEAALETLTTAIRKIDKETRSRFKDTFERVNQQLGELFPKVFGGGSARLELTGEDLLDTGVTLMARPPGKRNSSIHLLSGGEKAMTAVALIFAIFHLNPSPVCLLDEVDAPLDDTNVGRFAELIQEMSADVQFVVITHNKITMEMADHLMGVTMNEPGVSRLVTVDVEEAAAMAAV